MTIDEQRRRLGVAQVEALFGSILIATATASATSLFIAAGLISLGYAALGTGLAGSSISTCWASAISRSGVSTCGRGRSAIDGAPG